MEKKQQKRLLNPVRTEGRNGWFCYRFLYPLFICSRILSPLFRHAYLDWWILYLASHLNLPSCIYTTLSITYALYTDFPWGRTIYPFEILDLLSNQYLLCCDHYFLVYWFYQWVMSYLKLSVTTVLIFLLFFTSTVVLEHIFRTTKCFFLKLCDFSQKYIGNVLKPKYKIRVFSLFPWQLHFLSVSRSKLVKSEKSRFSSPKCTCIEF